MSELDDLYARIAALEQQVRRLPARWESPTRYQVIECWQGNNVTSGLGLSWLPVKYGLRAEFTTPIEEVPRAVPNTSLDKEDLLPDGLAVGKINTSGSVASFVWISTRIKTGPSATPLSDANITLIEGAVFLSRASYLLPVTGSGGTQFSRVYLPFLGQ